MPELPEVESMRRGIAAVAGSTIRECRKPRLRLRSIVMTPDFRTLRHRIVGRKIITVGRLGKRIVLQLDTDDRIVIEPRMSGLVTLGEVRDRAHLRLVIELSRPAKQLSFWDQRGLGVVRLVSPTEFENYYGTDKIGPDALEISADALRSRLAGSRREIKVALLDQRVVAGIGNIYASEGLHRARIHPRTPCSSLRPTHWAKLHAEIGAVLHEAIREQGSTLADKVYSAPDGAAGNYQRLVYQRDGKSCTICRRSAIVRIVQAQRSTFFCPTCQAGMHSQLHHHAMATASKRL
jgi:formamidopyrimidine-DNA glycosylase